MYDFKKGDKVECSQNGIGVVINTYNDKRTYPIEVLFTKSKSGEDIEKICSYLKNGKVVVNGEIMLRLI